MAPIISLDSPVEIMSPGLDEGLMCNSIFIGACRDISQRPVNTFSLNLGATEISKKGQMETKETKSCRNINEPG